MVNTCIKSKTHQTQAGQRYFLRQVATETEQVHQHKHPANGALGVETLEMINIVGNIVIRILIDQSRLIRERVSGISVHADMVLGVTTTVLNIEHNTRIRRQRCQVTPARTMATSKPRKISISTAELTRWRVFLCVLLLINLDLA